MSKKIPTKNKTITPKRIVAITDATLGNFLLNKKNITLDTHNLKSLWELLNVDSLKKNKDYKQLIALFEIVDNDGTKLRYVKNTKNEIQHKNPFFIRTKDIYITTIQLCKDLLNIDLKELN